MEVICNNVSYWSGTVEDKKRLVLDLPLVDSNELRIRHFGKRFGEGRIWDTRTQENKIVQDRAFVLTSLMFNEVDILKHIIRFPFIRDSGEELHTDYFGFNGDLVINFKSPVYEWIIEELVRSTVAAEAAPDLIIETSHNDLFDYSQDLVEIAEIKQLLQKHAHLFG